MSDAVIIAGFICAAAVLCVVAAASAYAARHGSRTSLAEMTRAPLPKWRTTYTPIPSQTCKEADGSATLKAELDPEPDAPTEPAPDLERVGLTVADLDSLQAPPIVTDADGDRWLCKDRRDGAYVWILEDGPTLERTSAGLVKQHGPIRRLL